MTKLSRGRQKGRRVLDEWRFVNEVVFFPFPSQSTNDLRVMPCTCQYFHSTCGVRTLAAAPELSDAAEGAPAGEFRFSRCKKGPSTRSAVGLHRTHTWKRTGGISGVGVLNEAMHTGA